MSDEADPTFGIPVEADYVLAIGRATYNFAYLEWGIVWLTETLQRGFLGKVKTMTAGQIAQALNAAIGALPSNEVDFGRLQALGERFAALVVDRNQLMHATPYTAAGGEQRLQYNGKSGHQDWPREEILTIARAFEDAATEASALLHSGWLAKYQGEGP